MTEAPLYPTFSSAEFDRRHHDTRRLMEEKDLPAVLFYGRGSSPEIQYLSNWRVTREAHLLFPRAGDPTLFVQLSNHLPNARRLSIFPDVRFGGAGPTGSPNSTPGVIDNLRERGLQRSRIGLVGPLPYRDYLEFGRALPEAQWVDFSGPMRDLRQIKSPEELDRIRTAAALSDRAVEALEREVRPGLHEFELGRIVEDAYAGQGGVNQIHFMATTPMREPRICVPSQHLSNRVLEKGDVLITEISASYGGYSGQILRTFTIGEGPTPQYQRLHDTAREAFRRVEAVLRDGAAVEEVLEATSVVEENGFSICDDLVHGANQLPPILRTRSTSRGLPAGFRYRENMAVVIQPNVITPDGRAGVQFGEMLRITPDGVERLHSYPRRLIVCGGA